MARRPRLTLLLLLLMATTAGALLCGCDKDKAGKKDKKTKEKQAIPVRVYTLTKGSIARTLRFDADVRGEKEVTVFAQVPERIVEIKVKEGDRVAKGQVLAVVRADSLSEQVRSAGAALEAAMADRDALKLELQRQNKLLARQITPQSQVDQLAARLKSAEAQIRRLRSMQGQANIARKNAVLRAPMAGVVGRRYLEVGDMAAPSLPLFLLVQMQKVELHLQLPEKYLALVRLGMTARLTVARFPGRTFVGTVARIAPTIDRISRTAKVEVVLANEKHELLPGMLARVELEVERHDDVVIAPYKSLIMEMGVTGKTAFRAFVVEKGQAAQHTITVGIIEGDLVEVTSGLAAGQTLVVRGQHLLEKGTPVNVAERLLPSGKIIEIKSTKPSRTPPSQDVPAAKTSAEKAARP